MNSYHIQFLKSSTSSFLLHKFIFLCSCGEVTDKKNLCFKKRQLWTSENEFKLSIQKNKKSWILKTVNVKHLLNFSDFLKFLDLINFLKKV